MRDEHHRVVDEDPLLAGELRQLLGVDRDERDRVRASIAVDHYLADERVGLEHVLDVLGAMFMPPAVTMMSFLRSVMKRNPSASSRPMSPVWNHPLGSKTSFVASGCLK